MIRKVLILGSGALKIGEAGEFDYSGSQALKALREEGIRTILVNPNIATVQTSEGVADEVYFLPVTPAFVEKVIKKERPDGILLSFGGQTALNCGVALFRNGVLKRYGVQVLGTPVETIIDTEDRELFVARLDEIGVKTIRSHAATSLQEARDAAREVGYPVIIRAAYALGGLGSGFCEDEAQLDTVASKAFTFSPQVLVEKSLRGWKEIEYEVVRDRFDNCITVCNMENVDPLGIHTGESIVVAPSQTLTNDEYHFLRKKSIDIVRHLGIVGECNVQYAFSPDGEDYRVIEVNARLSRSSALASKATGYPLAAVAAKLGLGYGLHELKNAVTHEDDAGLLRAGPGLCRREDPALGPGEVQGRFPGHRPRHEECRRGDGHRPDFRGSHPEGDPDDRPGGQRLRVQQTLCDGGFGFRPFASHRHAHFRHSRGFRVRVQRGPDPCPYPYRPLVPGQTGPYRVHLPGPGSLFFAGGCADGAAAQGQGRGLLRHSGRPGVRHRRGSRPGAPGCPGHPSFRQTDRYPGGGVPCRDELSVSDLSGLLRRCGTGRPGPQCHRAGLRSIPDRQQRGVRTLRENGRKAIMVNYNPETVSTDYDTCDRLYFDELSLETVWEICMRERPDGVVVSVGGQIPNNLALPLDRCGIRILGTSAADIDRAEDRGKFSGVVDRLGIDQPRWKEMTTRSDIDRFIGEVGFPVLVRPSYVLSGAAMNVCYSADDLTSCLERAAEVSEEHPVVVSAFLQRCQELECDAVADGGRVLACAISEHIEFAGVHSGDATIQFPAQRVFGSVLSRIRKTAAAIASELHITGPFNIQFLSSDLDLKVIECNLRASRSFPFVSKVWRTDLIGLATRCMLGQHPSPWMPDPFDLGYVGVKCSQFSFARLHQADPVSGVDMASTGEVGCLGRSSDEALLKAMLSVGHRVPSGAVLLSTGDAFQKAELLPACRSLAEKGYTLYATDGSCRYLQANGVPVTRVRWPDEPNDGTPSSLDLIREHKVDLVVNNPKNFSHSELGNGYHLRRAAVDFNVPLITDARLASAYIRAFCTLPDDALEVRSWGDYAGKW